MEMKLGMFISLAIYFLRKLFVGGLHQSTTKSKLTIFY